MRTINISLGGLKLEANFDLGVGEFIEFAILTNGTPIRCKGRILGTEDLKNKVNVRLRFAQISDRDFQKLAYYPEGLSPFRLQHRMTATRQHCIISPQSVSSQGSMQLPKVIQLTPSGFRDIECDYILG